MKTEEVMGFSIKQSKIINHQFSVLY